MKRFFLLLLCVIFFSHSAKAISPTDSLKSLLKLQTEPSKKLDLLFQLCELNRSIAIESFHTYAKSALSLSQELKDNFSIAKSKFYLSLYYYRISNIDSITVLTEEIKHISIDNKLEKEKLLNLANTVTAATFIKKNNQKEALSIYYNVLADAIKIKDSVAYFIAMNGVGWSNMELNRYDEAINWFHKSLKIPCSDQYERYKINTCINIASCYGSIGKINIAKHYILMGLDLARKYQDLFSIANGLNILGNVYIEEKQTVKAINCLREATSIREAIGDPYFIVSDMSQLALLYASNNEFDKAISLSKHAIEIATNKKLTGKMTFLYTTMSNIYYDHGDYKQAYLTLSELQKYRDEIYQNASAKELEELKIKYQTSLQESTIEKQQFQLTRKNYLLYGSLILFVLTGLLGFVSYRSFTHKTALKMQTALAEQREENAKAILEMEEKERTRFATDLHDGLGPMLSALKYNLSGLSVKLKTFDPEEKEVFNKAMNILDESCKEVRLVSHNIMPQTLLKKGLVNAVQDFISKVDNKNLQLRINTSGILTKLDPKVEIATYRIIQECVNNVIKHAHASKLDLSILQDQEGLSVTIEDNGIGFELDTVMKNGIGLNNIRTRVRYLNGELEIDSRPGNGTLIAFHIP